MLFVGSVEENLVEVKDTQTAKVLRITKEELLDLTNKQPVLGASSNVLNIRSFADKEILEYLKAKYKLANTLHELDTDDGGCLYYTCSSQNEWAFLYGTDYMPCIRSFRYPDMHSLTVPVSVKSLSPEAFESWHGDCFYLLARVAFIPAKCFKHINCSNQFYIPDIVERIGEAAFYGATVGRLVLPKALKQVRSNAFTFAKIAELVLPDSIRSFEPRCFKNLISDTAIDLVSRADNISIGGEAFWGCESLKSLSLVANNVRLGVGVFGSNLCLKRVELNCKEISVASSIIPSFHAGYITGTNKFDAFQDCTCIEEVSLRTEILGQIYFGCYLAFYHEDDNRWYCVYSGHAIHPSRSFVEQYKWSRPNDKVEIMRLGDCIPVLGAKEPCHCSKLKRVCLINSDEVVKEISLDEYYKQIGVVN